MRESLVVCVGRIPCRPSKPVRSTVINSSEASADLHLYARLWFGRTAKFGSTCTPTPNLAEAGIQTSASSTRKTLNSQQVRHIERYRGSPFNELTIDSVTLSPLENIKVVGIMTCRCEQCCCSCVHVNDHNVRYVRDSAVLGCPQLRASM